MIITVYIYGLRSSLERAYFRAAIRSIAFSIYSQDSTFSAV